jgi:hypothetical protein
LSNSIPDILQAPRPSRSSRRAAQLGIDQGPNKLAPAPVQQQPVQVGIGFGISSDKRQFVMVVSLGNQQIPVQLTPDVWDEVAAKGDDFADQVRAALAVPAEPEPDPVFDDDEALLVRKRAEECAIAYGKYRMDQPTVRSAFRHQNHLVNWAAKHRLDFEPDADNSGVTFYPAATPLPGPIIEAATPV